MSMMLHIYMYYSRLYKLTHSYNPISIKEIV